MNDNQEKNKGSTKTGLSQIQTKHVLSSSDSLSKHNHPARSKKFHKIMKKASRRRYNSPHIDDNSNERLPVAVPVAVPVDVDEISIIEGQVSINLRSRRKSTFVCNRFTALF